MHLGDIAIDEELATQLCKETSIVKPVLLRISLRILWKPSFHFCSASKMISTLFRSA